ncbi:hypothetical protein C8R46DRAFT_1280829 [Mycena filopes]|nr:hypothetical protein C8R46DRAFT_1280829 [Mycena filopes]
MSQTRPQIDIGQLTIPLFIGTMLNWAFLGVLVVQIYIYCVAFPRDRAVNKIIVGFVFLAEMLQTLGDSRNTVETFGSRWGDFEALDEVRLAWFSVPIVGSIVACVGQMFFAWRISIIGNNWYIPSLIAAITAFQLGAGIWTGVDIVRAKRFSQLSSLRPAHRMAVRHSRLRPAHRLCHRLLHDAREAARPKQVTTTALSRIIRVSAETGVLRAVFALLDLALFLAYNGNNYHLAVCTWLSKVYSNSVLMGFQILNSRAYIGHEIPADASRARMTDIVFQSETQTAHAIQISMPNSSGDDASLTQNSAHMDIEKNHEAISMHVYVDN